MLLKSFHSEPPLFNDTLTALPAVALEELEVAIRERDLGWGLVFMPTSLVHEVILVQLRLRHSMALITVRMRRGKYARASNLLGAEVVDDEGFRLGVGRFDESVAVIA
jgi:hypothetical protein